MSIPSVPPRELAVTAAVAAALPDVRRQVCRALSPPRAFTRAAVA